MAKSLESNLRQLLAHCEEISSSDPSSWRLKKYIKSLDTMAEELQSLSTVSRPSILVMDEYFNRVSHLKKLINYVPEDPLKPCRKLKLRQHSSEPHTSSVTAGSSLLRGQMHLRECAQIREAQEATADRTALMGGDCADAEACYCQQTPCCCGSSFVRRRRVGFNSSNISSPPTLNGGSGGGSGGGAGGGQPMGQAMKYYDDVQEQIADDMLQLTRNLREQTETANRIIRRDTEVVRTASQLSERNMSSLGRESEKLDEHSKRACKCWLWLMIGFVMVTFIFMVLFMKMMKKRV